MRKITLLTLLLMPTNLFAEDFIKIGQEILKFNLPQSLLDELSFDLKEMYLIFGTFKGEL